MIEIKPCYLFYGEEKYLIQRDVNKFVAYFVKDGSDDFNQTFYDGENDSIDEIIETALTIPLFADRRLIVVKNAKWFKENKSSLLVSYLKQPVDDTCIVFIADEIDKRREEVKLIAEHGKVREYKHITDRDMSTFIRDYLQKSGKTMDFNALQHFVMLTVNDLFIITGELDKLISYLGDDRTISLQMVENMIARTDEMSSFELINAIGSRNSKAIVDIIDEVVPNMKPKDELKLFGLIVSQIRLLVMVKELSSFMSNSEIANKLKVHEYRVKKGIEAAGFYTMDELIKSMKLLMMADSKMKSGQGDYYNILLTTLLEICSL